MAHRVAWGPNDLSKQSIGKSALWPKGGPKTMVLPPQPALLRMQRASELRIAGIKARGKDQTPGKNFMAGWQGRVRAGGSSGSSGSVDPTQLKSNPPPTASKPTSVRKKKKKKKVGGLG